MNTTPSFVTDNKNINAAYRIAVATVCGNIQPFKDGVLTEEKDVVIAGLGYSTPWTRDASINTWNICGLFYPDITENTLYAVINRDQNGLFIDGEYWDRIIWAIGSWYQYLYTGDKDFLANAYEAVCNSLKFFEETEYSEKYGLFRGAACYGDGIAAYPDFYAQHGESGIIHFKKLKQYCADKGEGLPLHCLSTNCLYYKAYVIADLMAEQLGKNKHYEQKAQNMLKAINDNFWSEKKGNYTYIVDDFGGCDIDEGMGSSFALLFGVADDEKAKKVIKNQHITAHGIPCVYPSFSRYNTPDGMGFGRHSGTVWPQIQGFWASAAAKNGNVAAFDREFTYQTDNAMRYKQFAEIYHPITGEIYGGRQEWLQRGVQEWRAEPFQTWSATAYLRNCIMDIVGLDFDTDGIHFAPVGSALVSEVDIKGIKYRDAVIYVKISGKGEKIVDFKLNGKATTEYFIPCDAVGKQCVEIVLE